MKTYEINANHIYAIYKRYVMRSPKRNVLRHTGQVDEVDKTRDDIMGAAFAWWINFLKNYDKPQRKWSRKKKEALP